LREDGLPSFRLEELTAANGISHEGAHDALSDVLATIELARLIRQKQPRLFDYLVNHRDKKSVLSLLDIDGMKPLLHVSGMFGAQRSNIALIVPLAAHPKNRNEVICWDLASDPAILSEAQAGEIQSLLYTRTEDLEGRQRPGLKSVHINKCPVLVTPKMADPATAARIGIDGDLCRKNLALLREMRGRDPRGFTEKIQAICAGREFAPVSDPDQMLYAGGFFSETDKRTLNRVRSAQPQDLSAETFVFEDKRLDEMLFRYRARNFPDSLSQDEHAQWDEFRFQRITEREAGASICMEEFQSEVEALLAAEDTDEKKRAVLEALLEYAYELLA
jgi:exodeoxyribonuclease-1